MKRMGIFLLGWIFFWCSGSSPAVPRGLISEIQIRCPDQAPRTFTDQGSMEVLLWYLRTAEVQAASDDTPVPGDLPVMHLILTHADGRHTIYQQAGDRFLRKNGGRWRCLDPAHGRQLGKLFCKLPAS